VIDALLIVAGGLLGSGHCIGMCGGFALGLGAQAQSTRRNLLRQLVYGLGRISMYVLMGAFVGFGSGLVGQSSMGLAAVQAALSIVAGVFLIAEGLFSTGLVPRPFTKNTVCPGVNVFASLLRSPNISSVFVAGLLNGLLPCGLVYAYLALAASTGFFLTSGGVMALFGLGTLPALVLMGISGSLVGPSWRQRILRLAACCMILTGLMALYRGAASFTELSTSAPPCPFCGDAVDKA
jgi:sulfite exporter TauE/SafE